MRLFFDAQLSGQAIGRHLRQQGHDILSLDEHLTRLGKLGLLVRSIEVRS